MNLWRKKREANGNTALLHRLHGRSVARLVKRDPRTYEERVIGGAGAFSVQDGELIISCDNKVLFRRPIKEIRAGELMNLSGVVLRVGCESYIAYYTDGTVGIRKKTS